MTRFSATLALLMTLISTIVANVLEPIPENASEGALKYQPVLDFDKDSCYQTAAIDAAGNTNAGLYPYDDHDCREVDRLTHCNTYVREHCNHGWCVYLYAYYFEKDFNYDDPNSSHTHEWEHVMVWTLNDDPMYVYWSAHGDYTIADFKTVMLHDNTHPKIVYHKGRRHTHSFRLAKPEDDAVENDLGEWFRTWLLSTELMDEAVRTKLFDTDFGAATLEVADDTFCKTLEAWTPYFAIKNEGFEPC